MAEHHITIELCHYRALSAMEKAFADWPQEKIDRFVSEWNAMQDAGAEIADVQFVGRRVVGYPSEDFTRHMAAFGVHL